MSSVIGEAFVRVRPLTSGFQAEAQGDVQKAGTNLGGIFAKAFAAAGFAIGVKSVVNAALEHQAAFAVLEKTVTNAGAQNELYGQSLEGLLEKEARLKGFSDEQLASAFQRLVSVTHDSGKAFKDLGEAEDLARFRHIGVEQAALALAKAEQGNATALQRYGIVVPKVSTAVDALQARYVQLQESGAKLDPQQKAQYENALKIAAAIDKQATAGAGLALVESRVGGSAATFASTAAGKVAIAEQNFHQFEVQLGDKVLPVLIQVGNHLETVGHIAEGIGAYFVASKVVSYFQAFQVGAGSQVAATTSTSALTAALVANTAALTGNAAAASRLVTIYGPLGAELSTVAVGEEAVGAAALTAGGEVSALSAGLAGLAALGPIAVVIALSLLPGNEKGKQALEQTIGGRILDKIPLFNKVAEQGAALTAGDPTKGFVKGAGGWLKGSPEEQLYKLALAGGNFIAKESTPGYKFLKEAFDEGATARQAAAAAAAAKAAPEKAAAAAAAAAKAAAAAHKADLARAGQSLIQSLTDGITSDQSDLTDLKTQMANTIQQGVQAVDAAVTQAKQNLNSIGQSLSAAITQILTKPLTDAQDKLTAAQNKLSLSSAQTTLHRFGEEILLPGGKQLSSDPAKALEQLQRLQKTKHGSPGLEAFIQQYQQAALGVDSAHLAIQQQQATQKGQRATSRIADLTDEFNKGQITARQLNVAITRELVRDGASYKRAGQLLGVAFADGFKGDLDSLAKQAAALIGGPQRPGSGLAPSIVRPIETLSQVTQQEAAIAKQQRDKQIDESKKQTQLLTKIHNRQAAAAFTGSLDHNPGGKAKTAKDLAGLGGG